MHDPKKKQELEQHEVTEVLRFLIRYGKLIGAGVVAAAVALIVSKGYAHHQSVRMATAEQMLRESRTPEQLEELVSKYSSTPVAPVALLDLAKTLFNSGDTAQAREKYQQFLKKYKNHELTPVAQIGLAYCTEADGTFGQAAEEFKAFLANSPDSYLQPIAVLSLARCLQQADRTDEARIVLEDFLAEHGNSPMAGSAEGMLDTLQ
jgi:predicted negative regulator of RcsB-dependent stress response